MSAPANEALNPLAKELNEKIGAAAPELLAMLSPLGRRLYFPRGILTQGAEAKAKGTRFNATIGIATEGGQPMHLPSLQRHLSGLSPAEIYDYAPASGKPALRERWREKQLAENPSQRGKVVSLPIVTSALTHGLSIVGDLFVAVGDAIVVPDQLWGNYRLTYEVRLGAKCLTFPFYAGGGFNTAGFAEGLAKHAQGREKLIVLLNFPNNPTGYMPTPPEGDAIARALVAQARRGTKLVVVTDDAYFGLFYHLGCESMTESLFGRLANAHPNLLAIKLDGATKELFVWGLRCGFITYGPGRAEGAQAVLDALEAKTKGAIRGAMSNSPMLSQSLVEKALASSSLDAERKQKCELLRERAARVYEVAHAPRFRESWDVYPFNSGYFMCIKLKGVGSERLRAHLLDAHQTGLISTSPTDLRIAFSCLEASEIEPLFEVIHRGIQELRSE
jgi:aspartate/methionine/tyrosine aminotransferase